jgi:hypothetical protein
MRFLRRTSKPCGLMHKGTNATSFQDYVLAGATDSGRLPQVALFYVGVGLMAAEFPVVCRWPEPSLL